MYVCISITNEIQAKSIQIVVVFTIDFVLATRIGLIDKGAFRLTKSRGLKFWFMAPGFFGKCVDDLPVSKVPLPLATEHRFLLN